MFELFSLLVAILALGGRGSHQSSGSGCAPGWTHPRGWDERGPGPPRFTAQPAVQGPGSLVAEYCCRNPRKTPRLNKHPSGDPVPRAEPAIAAQRRRCPALPRRLLASGGALARGWYGWGLDGALGGFSWSDTRSMRYCSELG